MSEIKGKLNALAVVLGDLIQTAVEETLAAGIPSGAGKTTKAGPGKKEGKAAAKAEKKDLAEKQKAAKLVAAKVLKEKGKDVLAELLGLVDATKFTDLKEAGALNSFVSAATERLEAPVATDEGDDLLGDGDEPFVERTLDDVKGKLLEINNNAALGKDVTKEILGELGVRRLPELKPEKYGEAYAAAEKALDNA